MKYIFNILNRIQKINLIVLTFLMIVTAGLEILSLSVIFIIINYFSNPDQLLENKVFNQLKELGFSLDSSITLLMILLTVFLLKTFSFILFTWNQSKYLSNLKANLSLFYFKGYLGLPRLFHLRTNISETVKNITYEVDCLVTAVSALSSIVMELTILITITIFLLFIDLKVTIFSFLILIMFSFIIYFLNAKSVSKMGKDRTKVVQSRLKLIIEGLSGNKTFDLTGAKKNLIESFNVYNDKLANIFRLVFFRSVLPRPLFEILIVFLITTLITIFLNNNKEIITIIPILGTFLAAGYRLVPSFGKILTLIQSYQFNVQAGLKLLRDKEKIEFSNKKEKTVNLRTFRNAIEIKDLFFSYEKNLKDEKKIIFKNINLKIFAGQKIGIMGDSGSGKSTLLDLIMGLLPPSDGKILIDGHDVKIVEKDWQSKIGCVPQEVFIADDSLKRNIAFGLKDEQIDENKIKKALQIANLEEFTKNLRFSFNSILGEQGARISGGQRQRIGIARAMFNNPSVLILDEATNALDVINEKKVIDEIQNNTKDKTVIIVTHNKDNLRFCDTVLKIENQNIKKL